MIGVLHLIPVPLGDNEVSEVIPSSVLKIIPTLTHFVVEDIRSARRFLSKAGLKGKIDDLTFYELNEHTQADQVNSYIKILLEGNDVGLISEAGLPAVADPGALLVEVAHINGVEVKPYVGPSSLMLALMASGLNGQSFAFTGYLPIKSDERKNRLKILERLVFSENQSQIIIETPYRNDALLTDILLSCKDNLRLTIAADITLSTELIKTKTVGEWKKQKIIIGKRPAVFLLG